MKKDGILGFGKSSMVFEFVRESERRIEEEVEEFSEEISREKVGKLVVEVRASSFLVLVNEGLPENEGLLPLGDFKGERRFLLLAIVVARIIYREIDPAIFTSI